MQRYGATWQDYLELRDNAELDWRKLAFDRENRGWLCKELEPPSLGVASCRDLITAFWGFRVYLNPCESLHSCGGCLIEKPDIQACAPDLVLYRGEDIPQ